MATSEQGREREGKARRRETGQSYLMLTPFLIIYFIFIFIPTIGMIVKSLTGNSDMDMDILNWPKLAGESFSLDKYAQLFTDSYFLRLLGNTVLISVLSLLVTVLIGTPISYQLVKGSSALTRTIKWIVSLPIYLPIVVIAYALVQFFGPHGVLNTVIETVFDMRFNLVFTNWAVVFGMVYVLLPMYIRVVAGALEKIPPEMAEASLSLGGSEGYTLIKVLLPIAMPSILAAVILNFSFAVGLVEIALIVGGGGLNVPYLPVEILQKAVSFNFDIPLISAMATVLLVISLLGQLASMLLLRRGNR